MNAIKPLKGYNVLVTRGKEQAADLIQTIAANGGIPHAVPLIDFVLPKDADRVKQQLTRLEEYDWLVFTSQNGVDFFFKQLQQVKTPLNMPKIGVIGNKTKKALARNGHDADFMPDQFIAEVFAAQFPAHLTQNDKVLIVKGNLARSTIYDEIKKFSQNCEEMIIYETIFPETSLKQLTELLQTAKINIVTFTSSSTVDHFMGAVNRIAMQKEASKPIIVCIGPITRKTAESYGLNVDVCPDHEYTTHAMIECLVRYLQDHNQKEELS
ncbi:uroporphyrinogen-III synthase [Peribacillus cavernae]|uniref:Uroporphyrinogen-III synthase n=1 Tax=Peribacillus cavernae TaxID=1674310 RepID=A0A3S0V9V2_9BACI|nr:uroporphyrinogen-III synthase [Peribacillus cavernae]MDQ0219393.1 uroporphyrinogen-III synthase [Peribacillus cavernae]RUQ27732.1 uroporphyrinogen-III synthase [Peribacillus cavernae]